MSTYQFVPVNNVNTSIAVTFSSSDTNLVLTSIAGLPTLSAGQVCPITLCDEATKTIFEICYITAITGTNLTVLRAQEGTSAYNWNVGDLAYCAPTVGSVATIYGNPANIFKVANSTNDNEAINQGQFNAARGTQANGAKTFSYSIPANTGYYVLSGHDWTLAPAAHDGFLHINTANNVGTPNSTNGIGLAILVNATLVVGDSILGSQSQSCIVPVSKGATPHIQIQVANFNTTTATSFMSTVSSWIFVTA